ncbi:MAG: acetate/propionate family kinase, partial [Planctomycetaceae bacterium]
STRIRRDVCVEMDYVGLVLDEDLNKTGSGETKVSAKNSRIDIWTVPTNEELVVARQTVATITSR